MRQADEVRAAADIVKIVGDYVKLRKAGVNLVGLCPFHQEKTPSFAVHPTKQIFHCFGCGVGGDVFKFVMLIEHLTFPEALERVAEKVGVPLRERVNSETFDAQTRERVLLFKVHELAAKFFASQLGGTAEGRAARGYLADRGLSDEVVGRFRLGYASSGGQALTRHLRDQGFEPAVLEKSGLVLKDQEGNRHFDRFRRRVIFPIANESGKVVAFGGRALGDDQPKYLNSPETPIYSKSRVLYHLDRAAGAIRQSDQAVLVEGYMDCIAVASAGVGRVVASCGTSLTESQIRLLGRYARRVVVNYDPDSAGVAATERSLTGLLEEGFEVKVLALPAGLDPDAFIRKHGAADYEKRVSLAPGYVDYLTERAAAQHDLTRPEGRVAAANAVLPHLAKVPDAMLRAQLAHGVALRLRVDDRSVQDELKRAAGHRESQLRPQAVLTPANHAVKQLLRACLQSEELADEFVVELVKSGDCEGLAGEDVFRRIAELRQRGEGLEVTLIEESLSTEERNVLYESLFWPGDAPRRELVQSFRQALRLRGAQRDHEKLQAAIERAEQEKDSARLAQLYSAKIKSAKRLQELGRPQKMLAENRTN
jgi:DNA primase